MSLRFRLLFDNLFPQLGHFRLLLDELSPQDITFVLKLVEFLVEPHVETLGTQPD